MDHILSAIGPGLIIFGSIMKVRLNLHFSLIDTICLIRTIWTFSYQRPRGRATFLTGASMVLLHVIMTLSMGFALKREYG